MTAQMLPPEHYVREVLAALSPLEPVETPLAGAHGLVLAQDVTAAVSVPPWTNSAMDGYALRAADAAGADREHPAVLPVSGDIPAGTAPKSLAPGTAMRIMTGAMVPEGADTVVRVEDTDQPPGPHPLPGMLTLRRAPAPGANIRAAGEGCAVGDTVVRAGTVLTGAALAAAASVGVGRVLAHPRPQVVVVSTGAELAQPGAPLRPGMIPDSNSLLLAGLVAEHGGTLAGTFRSGDTAEDLALALAEAAEAADLVLTSGGVSAGAFDPLTMLAALAARAGSNGNGAGGEPCQPGNVKLSFAKVAMQPGKPQGYGRIRTCDGRAVPLLCLPGNPVSVLVSFTLVAAPALAVLAGREPRPDAATAPGRARAAAPWRTAGRRRQYIPVRLVEEPRDPGSASSRPADAERAAWVEPIHRLGSASHLVASLHAADALAVVPAGTPSVQVGDEVGLIPLSSAQDLWR